MMRCHGEKPGRLELRDYSIATKRRLYCHQATSLLPPGDVANSGRPSEHRAFYKVAYDVRSGNVDLLD